ncbi:MAG: 50S ribosome-binding GTPase [Candidatus Lokiarchaeota archaeon]|nr:50S ribosome-binding GTPase [Candidatus Lokiarchaeota archaeon]
MEFEEEDNANIQKVVFVGLDNAGKSSIILSLLREISKFAVIKPTRNAERRTFEFLGMNISEWDLGGHERYRKRYLEKAELIFRGTNILIYVVDIQDYERIAKTYSYLKDIIDRFTEMKLEPPIHILFHKNDPDIADGVQVKINNTISYLEGKIGDFQNYHKISFYKTTVFDLSSIINAMSKILLSLFPRSKVIDAAIQGYVNKTGVEGVELIDDNSLIISSWYKNDDTRTILNLLSPYFLRLNDGFKQLENIEDENKNYIIVERYEKYFIFKQFTLIKGVTPYYISTCTDEPFLNQYEFNALINLLKDIISHEA